jgi:type VI secretion system secreted protein Hcp
VAIYMQYPNITGNVGTQGFTNQIELLSFSFGTGRSFGTAARMNDPTKRSHSEPSLSEISVTKDADDASDKLFKESLVGDPDNTVTITITKSATGGTDVETVCSFELQNATITGWTVSAGSNSTPIETITLTYSEIVYSNTNTSSKSGFNMSTMAPT